jgi:hypothetical protein
MSKKKKSELKLFKVTGYTRIEVKTFVKAKNEADALKKVADREVSICIHGTEDFENMEDWVYEDAPDMVEPNLAEEVTEEELGDYEIELEEEDE